MSRLARTRLAVILDGQQIIYCPTLWKCNGDNYVKNLQLWIKKRKKIKYKSIGRFIKCPKTTDVYVRVKQPSSDWSNYGSSTGDYIVVVNQLELV